MNHLCGLPHLNNSDDNSHVALQPYELETLAAFRQRFYDSAPSMEDYYTTGEEKKDQFECNETNLISRRILTPQYVFPRDKLPPSGWRPVDDCTLYRFLLADRHKDGSFDMEDRKSVV